MKPRTYTDMISRAFSGSALLMLMVVLIDLMPFLTVAVGNISLPGCPDKCGNIEVPYPFGIGENCSLNGNFTLSCDESNNPPTLFLFDNIRVLNISLGADSSWRMGQVWVSNNKSSMCYNHSTGDVSYQTSDLNLTGRPYWINDEENWFSVIGCDSLASFAVNGNLSTNGTYDDYDGGCIVFGCHSESANYLSCSGYGCCQTYLPSRSKKYIINFDTSYNNKLTTNDSSWCSYAMITSTKPALVYSSYTHYKLDHEILQEIPLVLDWAARDDETCDVALQNYSTYACSGRGSRFTTTKCVDSTNGLGYFCKCPDGSEGNPYLGYDEGGCRDIDECAKDNPCYKGKCHNTYGSYYCSCPPLMRINSNAPNECLLQVPSLIGIIIALGFGTGFVILLSYFAIAKRIRLFEKRRQEKAKQKFFVQNRGLLLQQLLDSHDEDSAHKMRIFSFDELEKATNRFDDALIIGQGGHGEVYKGILLDQRVVAIKRSKIVDQTEIDQFINEVAILSLVNHRNVVKLFGCCLETEVPLLVYEFISNGTLFNHLHAGEQCSLTWKQRLRIALETAGAISYLHSSASISIFHRDIKSSNILLDDYFTAKVSDFGASRSVQIDQTGITTAIQGTHGYLDPEYYYTGRLTQKSDVYSFGVILAELLTREKLLLSSGLFEGGSLISYFLSAMNDNRLFEVLDPQIVNEHNKIELETVAKLSQMCLRMKGEERPTMKEVELQLEVLWRSYKQHKHGGMSESLDERQLPLSDHNAAEIDIINQYSFKDQLPSSSNFSQQWNSLI